MKRIALPQLERVGRLDFDLGMPGLDGDEVCRRLRRMPELAGARVVAVTGWGQEADRRRSADAGFDHHLVKPADPDAIRRLF